MNVFIVVVIIVMIVIVMIKSQGLIFCQALPAYYANNRHCCCLYFTGEETIT